MRKCWSIPPKQNAAFVAAMEDVLDVYARAYNAECPVICMDEKPMQLLHEVREPLPMEPGKPERYDNEYKRNGTCSLFVFTEPLVGWRQMSARPRRTGIDFAEEVRTLLEGRYAHVPKIVLVMDNLNTHSIASLYAAFDPETANRLAKRIEIHHTPKHGSWLNVAEIELSVLSKQCLKSRMPDLDTLQREVKAWEHKRNAEQKGVSWHFTTDDARTRLKHLYPVVLS
nr:IS630 family transposase [Saccharibacillus qingshengii]